MMDQNRMASTQEQPGSTVDPVCGMLVDPDSAAAHVRYQGQDYHFCSSSCAEKFRSNPSTYLNPPGNEETSTQTSHGYSGTVYTCPMHPEVELPGPGACPKCGMALEPCTVTLENEQEDTELKDMAGKLWISIALTIPLVVVA
ncbi:MAG: YHS domain-containing protein, partial [Actinobacteria bacterium]|nr:YHS domain-containing protein [Actinomycetota bacterium]